MSFVNYSAKEVNFKFVYYGPAAAGKSTSLRQMQAVAEADPYSEVWKVTSLPDDNDPFLFCNFLDSSRGTLRGFKIRQNLYAVSGEVSSERSLERILKGADGVIFVADSQEPRMEANVELLRSLERNLRTVGRDLTTLPHAFQFNKRDLAGPISVGDLNQSLNPNGKQSFETVALSGSGVLAAFSAVAKQVRCEAMRR